MLNAQTLQRTLEYMFPSSPKDSWELQDMLDGQGVKITNWKLPDKIPTEDEIKLAVSLAIQAQATADATAKAEADKIAPASLEVRIKSLEERVTKLEKP